MKYKSLNRLFDNLQKEIDAQVAMIERNENRMRTNGFRAVGRDAEEVLKCLIEMYNDVGSRSFQFEMDEIPNEYHMGIGVYLDELKSAGLLSFCKVYIGGTAYTELSGDGIHYFEDKEKYEAQQKESSQSIVINAGGNSSIFLGNITNSTISIDNSISQLEKKIQNEGGEDKEELSQLLEEVKELLENMKENRHIPKRKTLINKISKHLEKHGWFYGEIVGLVGTATLTMLQG